jgi:Domain of Unknown Function (DUF1540)
LLKILTEVYMPHSNSMPGVSECVMDECTYNSNKVCHAIAITIVDGGHPMCNTFFKSSKYGGLDGTAGVGACKVAACSHNEDFECAALGIRVGHEQGKCMTFAAA